jgi:hypothetical protein
MSGILEIKRGSVDVATLNDGEFYLNKNRNSVQIGSGSAILTLLPINRTITGDIILNGNIYANNLTGSAALSSSLNTTLSVGGINSGLTINAGTDFNTIFLQLLAPYQKPVLSNAILKNVSTNLSTNNRLVGDTITFNKIIVTSSIENPGTAYSQNVSVTASGTTVSYSTSLGNLSTENNEISLGSIITRQRNTEGNIVFTINGQSSTVVQLTPTTITFPYYFANYLCVSTVSISTNAGAQSIIDDTNNIVALSIIGSKSWTATCTSENNLNKFTYIIYPESYGTLTAISQRHTDVYSAFTQVFNVGAGNYIFTLDNSNSITSTYYIYKSNASGAFADGVILTME